jgi:hypothetical protein
MRFTTILLVGFAATAARSPLPRSSRQTPTTYRTITAGSTHACALTHDGVIDCWGDNRFGQLGDGTTSDAERGLTRVRSDLRFVHVSAGATHTCALTTEGALYCWGGDLSGVLGDAATTAICVGMPCALTPTRVAAGMRFDTISAGYEHDCALRAGEAFCWGRSAEGQLGRPATGATCEGVPCSRTPVAVAGSARFSAISARGRHTCGIVRHEPNDSAMCWGDNRNGQLGVARMIAQSDRPLPVEIGVPVVSLSASGLRTCGVTTRGDAMCWGRADLSIEDVLDGISPQLVHAPSGRRFIMVSAGGTHTCALADDHGVYCWEMDSLGDVHAPTGAPDPVRFDAAVAEVSVGGRHTCALAGGRVHCWSGSPADSVAVAIGDQR